LNKDRLVMAQDTHFVNCPGCGAALEVISPAHDVKVVSLAASIDRWFYGGPEVSKESAWTKTVCMCGKKLAISWKFKTK